MEIADASEEKLKEKQKESEDTLDDPRTHALHILKSVVSDAALAPDVAKYVIALYFSSSSISPIPRKFSEP